MRLYLDASALVSITVSEPTSDAVDEALAEHSEAILTSDFGVAEASSAVMKLARMGLRSRVDTDLLLERLDLLASSLPGWVEIEAPDFAEATRLVRRHDLSLRAPDAIHIAAAHRLDATLVTLDIGMTRAARALGVPCINPAEAVGGSKD